MSTESVMITEPVKQECMGMGTHYATSDKSDSGEPWTQRHVECVMSNITRADAIARLRWIVSSIGCGMSPHEGHRCHLQSWNYTAIVNMQKQIHRIHVFGQRQSEPHHLARPTNPASLQTKPPTVPLGQQQQSLTIRKQMVSSIALVCVNDWQLNS